MSYKERMQQWMINHPDATVEDAFEAGWMLCTEEWCRHKRSEMEQICEMMRSILE